MNDKSFQDQTKFSLFYSNGERMTYGNCLVACIASLLNTPIEEVPNLYVFYGIKETDEQDQPIWLSVLNQWLIYKYKLRMVRINDLDLIKPGSYFIGRGMSMRDKPHCCIFMKIGNNANPIWDPHPTREGLKEIQYYYLIEKI